MNGPEEAVLHDRAAIDLASASSQRAGAQSRGRLALSTKLVYGAGGASDSIKAFSIGLFLLFFYTSVLGLPGTLLGLATAVGLLWDASVDPLVGYVSDRAGFRFGRRRSFMLVGSLFAGVCFYALFSPPAGLSQTALVWWLLASSLLLRTAHSIFMVPYYALGVELSADYNERTSVTAFRTIFVIVGTLLAAVASFTVFFPERAGGGDPKFDRASYSAMALVFGAAISVSGLIATFGTGAERDRVAVPRVRSEDNIVAGLLQVLRQRNMLILSLAGSTFFLASVLNASLAIHFLTYYAAVTSSRALSLIQFGFYAGALCGLAFWLRVSKRVDKRLIFIVASSTTGLILLAAYWLVGAGHWLGTGNVLALAVGNCIAGFFASAVMILPQSMAADASDEDELNTGRRRVGLLLGGYSLFHTVAASLAILAAGLLVDYFAGLVPGQAAQSAATTARLGMLYSFIPAGLMFVAAALMGGYGLTRQRVQAIQAELARAAAEETRRPYGAEKVGQP